MTTREGQVRTLEAVDGALRLSAPFLATDPGRLPGQLVGRLVGTPEADVDHLLGEVRGLAPRPWLCPLTPALAQSGGPLERVLVGHAKQVNAVTVTPNGARIVSGGDDFTVRIWDLASGRLERELRGHIGAVEAVAVTPDGTRIVSGGMDHTVRVWDLGSGDLERTLEGHPAAVRSVAVTPDGARVVSAGDDHTVRVWDIVSGDLERTLEGHPAAVRSVAVTPDGARIVSGGVDGTPRVWNLAGGQEVRSWTLDPGIAVQGCCAVPTDASLFVYGDSSGGVHVLRLLEARPPSPPKRVGPSIRRLLGLLRR